jgi:uncharacterized protein (DUF1810 family)
VPQLERFTNAQADPDSGFTAALKEMRAGAKHGHWIWYVFPQLSGLGASRASHVYGIADVAEAVEYLQHPVLRERLLIITNAVAEKVRGGISLERLMGSRVDVLKLISSLTLFGAVAMQLQPSDRADECARLATLADDVLRAADDQGFPRCEYTLASLRRWSASRHPA